MKKQKMLLLEQEPYEELRLLARKIGCTKTWIAEQVDLLISSLLEVTKQVIADQESMEGMSKEQAEKRYEDLARNFLKKKK